MKIFRKYFLICVLLLSISISGFAQPIGPVYKAEQGDFGIGLKVNGLINAISVSPQTDFGGNNIFNFRYFWKEQTAFRLGLGIDGFKSAITRVDSIGNAKVDYDSSSTSFNFYLNPEFEKHFLSNKRLDPFFAVGITLGLLGKNQQKSTRITSDTTGSARREYDGTFAGGVKYGVYTNWGVNYFLAPKLALGVEYRFGLINEKIGGDYNIVTIDTPISGQSSIKRSIGSIQTTNLNFAMTSNAIITLSYLF